MGEERGDGILRFDYNILTRINGTCVTGDRKRWAIVTNVRKPVGWFAFLNDPRVFAKLCYYLSFLFMGVYFYLARVNYDRVHREMDRRENKWHEVILDRWGDFPGAR